MSAQDIAAERSVADFYNESVRPAPEDRGPVWPRFKRFGMAFLTGYAAARTVTKLVK